MVVTLRRYPVKSMLGEDVAAVDVDEQGVEGDRRLALVDVETGRVATAKHPRLWRSLLTCTATGGPGAVRITLPDGRSVPADDVDVDDLLSGLLGRRVTLSRERAPGAEVERPAPEDVLEHGVEAEVDVETLEISQGTPGATFVDYAALHLITTATLDRIGVEAIRYRPNVVVETPPGYPAFAENAWVGREVRIGGVRARGTLPTPRCSVPTLAHGDLPRAPQAVRQLMTDNRVDVPGFGVLPCAGVYLEIIEGGTIRAGDEVVAA
ncbi:MOSC domain-containing protein [Pseudonocardia sp. H11422]|uniref:MOSC domain-containing protein n=1 Tax=Pseudonocardia sp. H11422 TaxID=2835866 RepID=UPI001BDD707C|nr:MOSC N-terminal beta barrel domain-containing protein [Pseudonocardia sp. H11422]